LRVADAGVGDDIVRRSTTALSHENPPHFSPNGASLDLLKGLE
jgi:hypothetical protein